MPNVAIDVDGLADLNRAFRRTEARLDRQLRPALAEAAEPVRADATALAAAIRNVGPGDPWAQARVGMTRNLVYVVPRQRGRQSRRNRRLSRPRFGGLLMTRAYEPALIRNITQVTRRVESLMDSIAGEFNRSGRLRG